MSFEVKHEMYTISTDQALLDHELVFGFLSNSYWARGRSREKTIEAIKHSVSFGVYDETKQIGFARVITDKATFGYIADLFILEAYRGSGLGKWLVESILECPDLALVHKWMLATDDAQGLYARFGFVPIPKPEIYMEFARSNDNSSD